MGRMEALFSPAKDDPVEVEALVTRSQHQVVRVTMEKGSTWKDYVDAVTEAVREDAWVSSERMIRSHTIDGNLPTSPYGKRKEGEDGD